MTFAARKTPSGKTVVPPDEDMESTEGVAPLTARQHGKPDPGSPTKPRTRLETIFDPPAAAINPQRLFMTQGTQQTPGLKLTRKAADESPVRQTKRRAVVTPGRIMTRTKSAAACENQDSGSGVKTPARSISRIPMMLGSVKSGKVERSKSGGGLGTPRPVGQDVFSSPVV